MYENYVYVCVNVPTFLFLLRNFLVWWMSRAWSQVVGYKKGTNVLMLNFQSRMISWVQIRKHILYVLPSVEALGSLALLVTCSTCSVINANGGPHPGLRSQHLHFYKLLQCILKLKKGFFRTVLRLSSFPFGTLLHCWWACKLVQPLGEPSPPKKEMQKGKMVFWGDLTNSWEKKRS